jgi:hypothetical protein
MQENLLPLLRKLKSLADQGVDGERENAAAMLERLCKNHGIDPNTIGEVPAKKRWFSIPLKKQRLFHQIVGSVLGLEYTYSVYEESKKEIGIILTDAQFIEIEAKFDFYWKAYERDLETFYLAFIHKNNLGARRTDDSEDQCRPLTNEEREDLKRIRAMMDAIKPAAFHKQIENS